MVVSDTNYFKIYFIFITFPFHYLFSITKEKRV
jgi:hypothetical protein